MSTPAPATVDQHYLVRSRTFERRQVIHILDELVDVLSISSATGRLIIDLSQGGVGSLTFEERQRIDLSASLSTKLTP